MICRAGRSPGKLDRGARSIVNKPFEQKQSLDSVRTSGTHASAPDDSYSFSTQVGHLLRRAYQRHLVIFQENSGNPQITSVQFVALCALRDLGPCSQSELVRNTAIDQGTIRGVINRLLQRKLITVAAASDDRRQVIATLTQEGEAVLADMIPRARQITELTLSGFNPAERVAMDYLLSKLIHQDDA
jgi:DNA-binding MarR family transcriptional regulator